MAKEERLINTFSIIMKRMPWKARFILVLSLIIVVGELISIYLEVDVRKVYKKNINMLASNELVQPDNGKNRERKDIGIETTHASYLFDVLKRRGVFKVIGKKIIILRSTTERDFHTTTPTPGNYSQLKYITKN